MVIWKNSAYCFKLILLGVILVIADHLFSLVLCPYAFHYYLFHKKMENRLTYLSLEKMAKLEMCDQREKGIMSNYHTL